MILFLYRIVGWAGYLVLYPYGKVRAALGSRMWRDRLGLTPLQPCDIWIHASSVGEVRVMANLVNYLFRQRPTLKLHLTTMTATGQTEATRILGNRVSLSHLPLDMAPAIGSTADRLRPRLLVIAETEIWPVLVTRLSRVGVPVVLVNGRMTERTFNRYRRIRGAMKRVLAEYDRFFFKTETDATRFAALGANMERGEVAGDMKFDSPLATRSHDAIQSWRKRLGVTEDDFLIVAGSTREGEDELLIEVLRSLRVAHPNLRMVIAPRHVERSESIQRSLAATGMRVSLLDRLTGGDDVIVVDKMGILNDLYMAADLAFVGGTLVDIGGHNILEPVWAGTPVLYGPSLANVLDATQYIEGRGYGKRVNSIDELRLAIGEVVSGRAKFRIMTEADRSASPTARIVDYILKRLADA